MNFITAHHAVAVFPRSTFVNHTSYICNNRPEAAESTAAWMQKYKARGFQIIDKCTPCDGHDIQFGNREVFDNHSWIIPFGSTKDLVLQCRIVHTCDTGTLHPSSAGYDRALNVPFQVLHWNIGVTCENAYLHIAEPDLST